MELSNILATFFLIICLALVMLAVGVKQHNLAQETAYRNYLMGKAQSMDDARLAGEQRDAALGDAVNAALGRVGALEQKPVPHFVVDGNAYCLVAQNGTSIVLSCRPW